MSLSWEDRNWLNSQFHALRVELRSLRQGEFEIMGTQEEINAAAAQIGLDVQGLKASGTAIAAEIAKLTQAGVDTSGLQAAISGLDTAVGAIASLAPTFQNVRLASDASFEDYQVRLVNYNGSVPAESQIPQDQYLTHTDDNTGTWDTMTPV